MPALKALFVQLAGWLTIGVMPGFGMIAGPRPPGVALLQAGIAAAAALALKQPRWWLPIHLAFGPAVISGSGLVIAPGWFLGGFAVLALIYWNSFRSQVPLYLSNRATAAEVARLLPADGTARLLDIGSGTGSLLARIARARPGCRLIGVETAPLPFLASWLRTRALPNCEVRRDNLWKHGLCDYDVAYAFLSPVPMPRLWRKALSEMRPGSVLVSNSFPGTWRRAGARHPRR